MRWDVDEEFIWWEGEKKNCVQELKKPNRSYCCGLTTNAAIWSAAPWAQRIEGDEIKKKKIKVDSKAKVTNLKPNMGGKLRARFCDPGDSKRTGTLTKLGFLSLNKMPACSCGRRAPTPKGHSVSRPCISYEQEFLGKGFLKGNVLHGC